MIEFVQDDGGRSDAGFKGVTGDCVVRAIAIASGKPYKEVYQAISAIVGKGRSPRDGAFRKEFHPYILSLGFTWVPTMKVGQGCTVHLRSDELPSGRLIVRVSKHIAAVVDGKLRDNHDSSRGGSRCVYGYYIKS